MGKNKKKHRGPKGNLSKSRNKRRKPRTRQPSLGNLIAKGTMSLLSYLPAGEGLKPIADYAFRSFGWSSSMTNGFDADTTLKLGVGARFKISYAALALNSHLGITNNTTSHNMTKTYTSQFYDARLISLTITLRPINALAERQGEIAAVFLPFMSDADEKFVVAGIPSYRDVQNTRGAKSGVTTKPLILTYRPNGQWIKDYHPLECNFGVCQIAYLDSSRIDMASSISPSEFTIETKVTGEIQFQTPIMASGSTEYNKFITDCTPVGERIDSTDGIYYINGNKVLGKHAGPNHLISHYHHSDGLTM